MKPTTRRKLWKGRGPGISLRARLVLAFVLSALVTMLATALTVLTAFQVDLSTHPIAAWMVLLLAILLAAILLLSTLLGLLLAGAITQPLRRVETAAAALRSGVTTMPVPVDSPIREVSQVARALEDARITLHHSLAENTRQIAWTDHLLESIVEGILTFDHLGRITFFSQGAEHITGWSQEELIGRRCDDVFHLADQPLLFSQVLPAPGQRRKLVLHAAGERLVTLSMTRGELSLPAAGNARAVLVFRDVTDEEGLRKLLGEFLANITHEFRTPLSALAASIELLYDQLPDLSLDEIRELLGSIELGTLDLQTLIDNLLEGASIETGKFRVFTRPVQVEDILQQSERIITPLLHKYRLLLRLEMDPDLPAVLIDARRTGQVLINLLNNAIKSSPEGGMITLSARAQDENQVLVQVSDEGPGIAPEHLPGLFNRFMRFDVTGRPSTGGAGLGLSVVKAIVEAQGGQVGMANRAGRGAQFWFTLPIVQDREGTI